MHLVVTCGPAHEPIDPMRRITNRSTGRLGTLLAEAFRLRGHAVTVLRGEGATFPPLPGPRLLHFGTNTELEGQLGVLAAGEKVDAVFHAAALCDFGVAEVRDAEGNPAPQGKLPSRSGGYLLRLEPLPKVLPRLRLLFPDAFIAGWKYETEGGREGVKSAARRQLKEAGNDLCVVNGPAFGPGFGLLSADDSWSEAADVAALAEALAARLG